MAIGRIKMARRSRFRIAFTGCMGIILLTVVGLARLYSLSRPGPGHGPGQDRLSNAGVLPGQVQKQEFTSFQQKILADLHRQISANIRYEDTYFRGGEPPAGIGVCTDVILRAYRAAGVHLQQEVGRDIKAHLSGYHLAAADPNIDHRRCRNLVIYLRRRALTLPNSGINADWQPGDIVFWSTGNRDYVDHCGVIASGRGQDGSYTVVHRWPNMPVAEIENVYRFRVRYHFRWQTAVSKLAVNTQPNSSL